MIDDCIFCKILARQQPATLIAENDSVIVIKDIAPKAPTHYLIIPKKHIKDLRVVHKNDAQLLADMLFMTQQLALDLGENTAF